MIGIVLAGGLGSRLHPLTLAAPKQLLPVYNRPMVMYPLQLLHAAGAENIVVVVKPEDLDRFQRVISAAAPEIDRKVLFVTQERPAGVPDALRVALQAVSLPAYDTSFIMALGDGVFLGKHTPQILQRAFVRNQGCTAVVTSSLTPYKYGVITEAVGDRILRMVEKPLDQPSPATVLTGLTIFDRRCLGFIDSLAPSARGELELVDLLGCYAKTSQLFMVRTSPQESVTSWYDCGDPLSLLLAGDAVYREQLRSQRDDMRT